MDTEAELARLRYACRKNDNDIEQVLGRALGYPRYCDDQINFPGSTDADGVCVGDQVAASLAMQAADRIKALTAELEQARADADTWKKRYFDAGRSEDAFAADMARVMVSVFKKDEALLAELEAMTARKDSWRRAALYWRKEWGLYTGALLGDSYVARYLVGRSVSQRNIRRKQAERGQDRS